jgi:ribosome maturation factor RimP
MIELQNIIAAVEQGLRETGGTCGDSSSEEAATGLFPVEVKMHGDEIEVFIDSDARGDDGRIRGVSVEDCIALSRAIESRFDRDAEDFSLTVSSAGIGQPLKVLRQYRKLIGSAVEVVLNDGTKFTASLEAVEAETPRGNGIAGDTGNAAGDTNGAGEGSITLSYSEKRKVEGKKRAETVAVTKTFPLSEVKSTKEYIDFK